MRPPLRQHREAPVVLPTRRRDDALGDLALEHQRQALPPGRPGLDGQPARQERRADVVGEIGDDPDRLPAGDCGIVRLQRVAFDYREPARRRCRDLVQRRDGAPVALDGGHVLARLPATTPVSARRARGRPRRHGFEASGPPARAMRRVRLRSSRKFWPSDFRASSACAAITSRSGGRLASAASSLNPPSRAGRARRPAAAPRSGSSRVPFPCRRATVLFHDRATYG